VLTDARFEHARLAEVPEFDATQFLGDKGLRNLDRATKMLVVAAKHALEDAGLKRDGAFLSIASERIGICAATAYGSLDSITEINRVAELEHPRYLNPSRFPNTVINAAAGYVSIWEGLEGPNVTVVDGNCGGADVVLTAETHLACGRADALLVGGFEVLNEPLYLAFVKLGIIVEGEQFSSPGEVASRGTHLGEGAALMVLEPLLEAHARGAQVLAEVVGFGSAFEPPASAAVLVHASDKAVERAVQAALLDAQLEPANIDLVICSESGVNRMDMAEEEGLARVFGSDVATIATKALWGETFGASAALSVAATLAWFSGVPPAPLLRGELRRPVRTALITAMGYYGNVSVVIVKKAS
jgi:3-oxoacyl-(acyl-carrier-protein) synthase